MSVSVIPGLRRTGIFWVACRGFAGLFPTKSDVGATSKRIMNNQPLMEQ